MNKNILASKTVLGGALLSIEAGLLSYGYEGLPWLQVLLSALGTFLTVYGFRDAMTKNC